MERLKFYYSEEQRANYVRSAPFEIIERPEYTQGYIPLLAKLDSGEIVEYTEACKEEVELNHKSRFTDSIYLGTGVQYGYGEPVKAVVVIRRDQLPQGMSAEELVRELQSVQEAGNFASRDFVIEDGWPENLDSTD
jgi:hypothetical protein